MKRASFAAALTVALVPLLAGCGDDGNSTGPQEPEATLDLIFTGDASFQGAHGGQTIHVAIVDQEDGAVVAGKNGTVSSDSDPAFEFTFTEVLVEGQSYHLDYWIDSNFDGGTEGTCDPPSDDHQWRMDVPSVSDDVTIADTHRPTETESVCSTFGGSDSDGDDGTNY